MSQCYRPTRVQSKNGTFLCGWGRSDGGLLPRCVAMMNLRPWLVSSSTRPRPLLLHRTTSVRDARNAHRPCSVSSDTCSGITFTFLLSDDSHLSVTTFNICSRINACDLHNVILWGYGLKIVTSASVKFILQRKYLNYVTFLFPYLAHKGTAPPR